MKNQFPPISTTRWSGVTLLKIPLTEPRVVWTVIGWWTQGIKDWYKYESPVCQWFIVVTVVTPLRVLSNSLYAAPSKLGICLQVRASRLFKAVLLWYILVLLTIVPPKKSDTRGDQPTKYHFKAFLFYRYIILLWRRPNSRPFRWDLFSSPWPFLSHRLTVALRQILSLMVYFTPPIDASGLVV